MRWSELMPYLQIMDTEPLPEGRLQAISANIVLDDSGNAVPGPLACGRLTRDSGTCTIGRAEYAPACRHHVTEREAYAADVAREVVRCQGLMRIAQDAGFDLYDLSVREQVRRRIHRDRAFLSSIKSGADDSRPLTYHDEQLAVEPVTRLFAEQDRVALERLRSRIGRRRH